MKLLQRGATSRRTLSRRVASVLAAVLVVPLALVTASSPASAATSQFRGMNWPALGGKPGSIGYDHYSMYSKSGSGTSLSLTIRNQSGADRLRYGFGDNVGGGGTSPTAGTIVNLNSGKCIDIVGASTANGAEASQYTCGSGTNQQFTLVDKGSGYFNIVAVHSGKCLDVTGASTADGATIKQYTCGSGTNQQFTLQTVGSNKLLVARHSGKCIDVPGWSTDNGVRLKQYTCNSGANQLWSM